MHHFDVPYVCVDELLKLLKHDLLPNEDICPKSNYEAKKMVKKLGLSYKIISSRMNSRMQKDVMNGRNLGMSPSLIPIQWKCCDIFLLILVCSGCINASGWPSLWCDMLREKTFDCDWFHIRIFCWNWSALPVKSWHSEIKSTNPQYRNRNNTWEVIVRRQHLKYTNIAFELWKKRYSAQKQNSSELSNL